MVQPTPFQSYIQQFSTLSKKQKKKKKNKPYFHFAQGNVYLPQNRDQRSDEAKLKPQACMCKSVEYYNPSCLTSLSPTIPPQGCDMVKQTQKWLRPLLGRMQLSPTVDLIWGAGG